MYLVRYVSNIVCDAARIVKSGTARTLREAGLELDMKGSKLTKDIGYL